MLPARPLQGDQLYQPSVHGRRTKGEEAMGGNRKRVRSCASRLHSGGLGVWTRLPQPPRIPDVRFSGAVTPHGS